MLGVPLWTTGSDSYLTFSSVFLHKQVVTEDAPFESCKVPGFDEIMAVVTLTCRELRRLKASVYSGRNASVESTVCRM